MPSRKPARKSEQQLAAVDLGSNSFHMIVARVSGGRLHVIDRLREMVQLGAGLDKRDRLTKRASTRALDCLKRFGERLRGLPPGSVRIVGTNTLRRARNADDFIVAAERALGHPIEVIAGREEARLIYLGVAHSIEDPRRRLVMDIGGGSTELIIGKGFEPQEMESLFMGCVSMSKAHFPKGNITRSAMDKAVLAAHQELQGLEARYRRIGWKTAIGASGTINTVADVIRRQGWRRFGISLPALRKLRKALIDAGHVDKLDLPGLSDTRASVFPGGVAILIATFEALGIDNMRVSDGALREGLLYDLLGRIRHEDVRGHTVTTLAAQHHVDVTHARRVEQTAVKLLEQVARAWKLTGAAHADMLRWAAGLHEVGLSIAHTRYHKHGAYLLEHADLPGFSRQEQRLLAVLVRAQRRKFPMAVFNDLPAELRTSAIRLAVLLRLALLLHHNRSPARTIPLRLRANSNTLQLKFTGEWLQRRPLMQADLAQEVTYLKAARIKLKY